MEDSVIAVADVVIVDADGAEHRSGPAEAAVCLFFGGREMPYSCSAVGALCGADLVYAARVLGVLAGVVVPGDAARLSAAMASALLKGGMEDAEQTRVSAASAAAAAACGEVAS